MRRFKSQVGCVASIFWIAAAGQAAGQSTLPNGVQQVSPSEGTSIRDPEQLLERTPGHLIQDLHAAFGSHQARAVHSKGVILSGSFVPSAEAKSLSHARLFLGTVPIIVRFSDFTGIPKIPDTERGASPRGFAVKFLLPDGSNCDVVSHSFNGFPVPTASQFGELLRAIGASGRTASKPTALDAFLASHPVAKHFLTSQDPPPVSWGTTAYFGVNSFEFTNSAKRSTFVRYRFVPEAGERYLTDEELAGRSPDYLPDEIAERVSRRPIRFTWYAQLSGAGDAIEDPSVAWPKTRPLVKLGVITIDYLERQTSLADRSVLFLPGSTPPGVAVADPMLTIRNAAYPLSYHDRQ